MCASSKCFPPHSGHFFSFSRDKDLCKGRNVCMYVINHPEYSCQRLVMETWWAFAMNTVFVAFSPPHFFYWGIFSLILGDWFGGCVAIDNVVWQEKIFIFKREREEIYRIVFLCIELSLFSSQLISVALSWSQK